MNLYKIGVPFGVSSEVYRLTFIKTTKAMPNNLGITNSLSRQKRL